MADLLVIVPSRGRPHNIARLVEGWSTAESAHLLVAVDDDDPTRAEYDAPWLITGPRRRLGPTLNRLAVKYAPSYRMIGFMGDDHLPRTLGWDTAVRSALDEMGTGIVYGDDLLQHERLPTAVFMTSDIVEALGYMSPPDQVHLFLDDFWLALGRQARCIRYLPDVVIEHLHPFAHKAPMDERYRSVNNTEMVAADKAAWEDYQRCRLPGAVEKVRRLCESSSPGRPGSSGATSPAA